MAPDRQNSGCLFPFGRDLLPLFVLMLIDGHQRKQREEELEDEDLEEEPDELSGLDF